MLYFVGDDMESVYDYLAWRANIRGYVTLDGLRARGSSEMINDILRRTYLRDILDDALEAAFTAWREPLLSEAGLPAQEQVGPPIGSIVSATRMMKKAVVEDQRLASFLRTYSPISKSAKLAIWEMQRGRCAVCHHNRPLKIVKRVRVDHKEWNAADEYVAACVFCRKKHSSLLQNCRR